MLWRGTFQNGGCLRTAICSSEVAPILTMYSINRVVIDGCLIDCFVWHVSDNPKLEKYSRYVIQFISMGYIY